MLTALYADVHANREALAACLARADALGAKRHVFLGDHVGYGPDPAEVLDMIAARVERGGIAVAGNHDRAAIGKPGGRMTEVARLAIEWTRSRLEGRHRDFLDGLPVTAEEAGRLYVHANAWDPERWEYVTGVFDAARSMRATTCRWTLCGHVHTPGLYHMTEDGRTTAFAPAPGVRIPLSRRRRWLAIPGSVGQPRDANPAACLALLEEDTMHLTFLRVPYDTEATARRIRASGLPAELGSRLVSGT